jgi:two-component system response regulator FixJ
VSSAAGKGRVCVVDDDSAVRDALKTILEDSGYEVLALGSSQEFLDSLDEGSEPACILSDVRMPEMSGLDLLKMLSARGMRSPIILITGFADVPMAVGAMKAGAADFIEKPFTADRITSAVAAALDRSTNGEGPNAAEQVRRRVAALTQREQEIMALLVTGHSNKSAARELSISPRTVEVHRARVMQKMEARNLAELVRMSVLISR